MKTLVLGLGNTLLTDDGVGIYIAREIKKNCKDVEILEAAAAGFRIVDEIIGFKKLIIIDSIITGNKPHGFCHRFSFEEFNKTLHFTSPHDISLFEAFEIMKKYNAVLPEEIDIYAIEVKDTQTLSEKCSKPIESKIKDISSYIIKKQELKKIKENKL